MVTIYKYELEIEDKQTLCLYKGAVILSAQVQNGPYGPMISVWAISDTSQESHDTEIVMVGTGTPMPEDREKLFFINTVQLGVFVCHIFERITDVQ